MPHSVDLEAPLPTRPVLSWILVGLIALAVSAAVYLGGRLAALGLFIALDAIPHAWGFVADVIFEAMPLVLSLPLFFMGRALEHSPRPATRTLGGILFVAAAIVLGLWIGIVVSRFTVPHSAEDLGIFYGPGEAALIALGVLCYRSVRVYFRRLGFVIIILGSCMLAMFAEVTLEYSYFAQHFILTMKHVIFLRVVNIAVLLTVPVLTAVLLLRRQRELA